MELRPGQFSDSRSDKPEGRRGNGAPALPLILSAAFAAAIMSWFVPVGLYEVIVESSGLSELFGSFAAPLGLKARLLIALASGIAGAVLVALMLGALSRNGGARGKPSGKSRQWMPKSDPVDKGAENMASQAAYKQAADDRAAIGPGNESTNRSGSEPGLFDRMRNAFSFLPAPRRYDEETGPQAEDSDFAAAKRLRTGGLASWADSRPPRPVAAHAELGDPLPPLELGSARLSNDLPIDQDRPVTASPPVDARQDDSIEQLAGRLAQALGQASARRPDQSESGAAASSVSTKEHEERVAMRDMARQAVGEAEAAVQRAELHAEQTRKEAERSVEEADSAVERAGERLALERGRLTAAEDELQQWEASQRQAAEIDAPALRSDGAKPGLASAVETAPVSADEDHMDPALRDALRTLRRLSARD